MPTYDFYNKKTKKSFSDFMSISAKEEFLQQNPHIEQKINTKVNVGDPINLRVKKPASDFQKYVLGRIKEVHPKGTVEKRWQIAKEI